MSSSLKKHIFKTKFLKASLEEAEEKHDNAKIEFFDEIRTLQSELNVYDPALDDGFDNQSSKSPTGESEKASGSESFGADDIDSEEEEENDAAPEDPHPPWAKKLYRSITLKTHPDKLLNLSEKEREEKVKIYTAAVNDYASRNYSNLVIHAIDLEISLPDSEDITSILKSKCNDIEKDIEKIKQTLFWIWYHSDADQRREILRKFVEARGWTAPGAAVRKSRNRSHPGKSLAWARKKLQNNDV